MELTAYADDNSIIVSSRTINELNNKSNVSTIQKFMNGRYLRLINKTGQVIFKRPIDRKSVNTFLEDDKHLEVWIDTQGYFGTHMLQTIKKEANRIGNRTSVPPLSVIGPNIA